MVLCFAQFVPTLAIGSCYRLAHMPPFSLLCHFLTLQDALSPEINTSPRNLVPFIRKFVLASLNIVGKNVTNSTPFHAQVPLPFSSKKNKPKMTVLGMDMGHDMTI